MVKVPEDGIRNVNFYRRSIIVGGINNTHFNHLITLVYSNREVINLSNCACKDSHYKRFERGGRDVTESWWAGAARPIQQPSGAASR